ncbi:MAG TPA: hypothetical protein VHF47_10880 [Acidimicrobiales bacterium]|nr:hypothetical protein [Acidimicrobiales bacterium]
MTVVERPLGQQVETSRFEHHSPRTDDALGVVRRRFFDWLQSRSFTGKEREDLLAVLTVVAEELTAKRSIAFTVTAEDAGENVLLRFDTTGVRGRDPVRLGRCLAALDRLGARSSVGLVPMVGDGHLLVDVVLPISL